MKWLVLIAFVALAKSEDYDCPAGKSSKTITIGEGDSFEFNSNPNGAEDYKNKQKCTVKYKKATSCNEMKFECQSFNVQNNAQNCKKGDKLFIGKNVFCQTQAVSETTTKKVLKVRFISNKKKTESGAQCTISCIDPEPPVSTEAPSSPSTTEACGPDSCGLQCEGSSKCVQNQNIQCLSSPCCPQWSCLSCPKEMPEINGPCNPSDEGLECQYGKQTCCGVEHANFLMQCTESQWATIQVETPCMFGVTCPPTICPAVYQPVCGSNNVTYSNACQAAGVEVSCQGECPCPNCQCQEIYAPVCGTDGKTYENSCYATECVRVEIECEQECPCQEDIVCPAVYEPVCGSNEVTYSNACEAAGANVEVSCQGECPCPKEDFVVCLAVYEPVCGSNNVTYSNSCYAANANIEVSCQGECPCVQE